MATTDNIDGKSVSNQKQQVLVNKSIKTVVTMSANLCRKQAGSNWESAAASGEVTVNDDPAAKIAKKKKKPKNKSTKYVALDCEMVGIGPNGNENMLARVSIVSQHGHVLLDKYVKPHQPVVDYRTKVSGIRPKDIENGEDFETVQDAVINILQDKVLVGHSVNKDLEVLLIRHPSHLIRDTAKYKPLAKLVSNGATPSLKRLAEILLNQHIQRGEHNSVEDAKAAMAVYNKFGTDWENYIKRKLYNRHYRHGR